MITPEIASTDRVLCYPSGLNGGQPNELLSYSSVEKRLGTDNPNKTAGVTGLQVEAVSGGKFQMVPLLSPVSLVSAGWCRPDPQSQRRRLHFSTLPFQPFARCELFKQQEKISSQENEREDSSIKEDGGPSHTSALWFREQGSFLRHRRSLERDPSSLLRKELMSKCSSRERTITKPNT